MKNSAAILFPGQGSQSSGMLSDVDLDRNLFNTAEQVLGYDLYNLIQGQDEESKNKLNQSEFTQPAILATSIAYFNSHKLNLNNNFIFAGHSLGEYSALVAAGVLDFAEAVKLVQMRGRLMQQAGDSVDGVMAAIIGLSPDKVRDLCSTIDGVELANINTQVQIVVSGQKASVLELIDLAKDNGAKRGLLLPVSVPAHSSLMAGIVDEFAKYLAECNWKEPKFSVLLNYKLQLLEKNNFTPEFVQNALMQQLTCSVDWLGLVTQLYKEFNINDFYEVNPGIVLTGLTKKIVNNLTDNTQQINWGRI